MPVKLKPGTFLFLCHACTARLVAKEENRGKKIRCPKCQKVTLCKASTPGPGKPKPAAAAPTQVKKATTPAAHKNASPAQAPASAKSLLAPKKAKEPPPSKPADPKPTPPKSAPARRPSNDEGAGMSSLVLWGSVLVLLFLLSAGAYFAYLALFSGPKAGALSGTVVYEGKPLSFGEVILTPKSGIAITCPIQADGTYQAKDVEYGQLLISVRQLNPELKSGAPMRPVPEIYGEPTTSPLRFTLNKPTDKFDIFLIFVPPRIP